MSFIPVIKAEFSALLQFSVSHDTSEIILIWRFDAQETFMIVIINVENSCISVMFRHIRGFYN